MFECSLLLPKDPNLGFITQTLIKTHVHAYFVPYTSCLLFTPMLFVSDKEVQSPPREHADLRKAMRLIFKEEAIFPCPCTLCACIWSKNAQSLQRVLSLSPWVFKRSFRRRANITSPSSKRLCPFLGWSEVSECAVELTDQGLLARVSWFYITLSCFVYQLVIPKGVFPWNDSHYKYRIDVRWLICTLFRTNMSKTDRVGRWYFGGVAGASAACFTHRKSELLTN